MQDRTNDAVAGALAQMDRHAQRMKLAIGGAVAVEGLLLAFALWRIDWSDRIHVLLFVFAVLGYTTVALGLAALGAHVSRVGARIVAALDDRE